MADEHEDGAQHHFTAIVRSSTGAKLTSDADLGNITHPNRHTTRAAEDDIADVLKCLDLPGGSNQVLLTALFDITRAHVAVVAIQGRHNVLQGDAQRGQSLGYR
ncbi:MAG: hypothetical protein IOMNBAOH_01376 [Rhodocyclaceae bacterium]|nr:hypothetical protein [Rhodocyclaceae bacterium]